MTKICPRCGATNEDDTNFCTNCNEKLSVSSTNRLMDSKDFEKPISSEGRSYIPITDLDSNSIDLNKKTITMIISSILLIVLISSTIIVPWFSVNQNINGPASSNFAMYGNAEIGIDIQYDFNLKEIFVKYSTASSMTLNLKSSFPSLAKEYDSNDKVEESMGLTYIFVIIGIVFSIISFLMSSLLIAKKIPKKFVIPFVTISLIMFSITLIHFSTSFPNTLDETLENNDLFIGEYLFLYPINEEFNGELMGSTNQYIYQNDLSYSGGFFADSSTKTEAEWGPSMGFYMILVSIVLSFILLISVFSWVDPKKFKHKVKNDIRGYPD